MWRHQRHVSDHYRILLDALERSSEGATTLVKGTQQGSAALSVNYDARDRDVACETSRAAALTAFRALAARLRRAKERDIRPDWPVELDAVTPIPVRVPSSWSRELWFCSLHAGASFLFLRRRRPSRAPWAAAYVRDGEQCTITRLCGLSRRLSWG